MDDLGNIFILEPERHISVWRVFAFVSLDVLVPAVENGAGRRIVGLAEAPPGRVSGRRAPIRLAELRKTGMPDAAAAHSPRRMRIVDHAVVLMAPVPRMNPAA